MPARLGLVCGVAFVALAGPASAEEGVAFKNLMGTIGIIPKEKDTIHYRERAPLVLPPKAALPSPVASAGTRDPQWPNDPDVAAGRRRREEAARPVTWSETRRMADNNARLTPAEIQAGRTATNQVGTPGSHRSDNARDVLYVNPDSLRAKSASAEDDKMSGAEPTRSALTDPPSGFRRSSNGKALKAEYTPKIDQQERDASPIAWLTRKFSGANDDD